MLEHQAWSCSVGRLPSLLEELHGALLQGQVCQLQHALPMQHVPGVRGQRMVPAEATMEWLTSPCGLEDRPRHRLAAGTKAASQWKMQDPVRSDPVRVSERLHCVHTRGICELQSELKVLFRHFILKLDSRITVYHEWKSSKHEISENSKQSGVNE